MYTRPPTAPTYASGGAVRIHIYIYIYHVKFIIYKSNLPRQTHISTIQVFARVACVCGSFKTWWSLFACGLTGSKQPASLLYTGLCTRLHHSDRRICTAVTILQNSRFEFVKDKLPLHRKDLTKLPVYSIRSCCAGGSLKKDMRLHLPGSWSFTNTFWFKQVFDLSIVTRLRPSFDLTHCPSAVNKICWTITGRSNTGWRRVGEKQRTFGSKELGSWRSAQHLWLALPVPSKRNDKGTKRNDMCLALAEADYHRGTSILRLALPYILA